MKSKNKDNCSHSLIVIFLTVVILQTCASADRRGWQKEQADWQLGSGLRIKSIIFPPTNPPIMRSKRTKPVKPGKKRLPPDSMKRTKFAAAEVIESLYANVIDSPPVDGFVPYIAVEITNARGAEDDPEAAVQNSIVGNFLTDSPQSNYVIGIFDTGASAHVMGYSDAITTGIFSTGLYTTNTTTISGVTGETEAWVSYPLGIFIDGLGAIEPNGLLWNRSGMIGQSNVSIAIGQGYNPVDLPTAIGSPMWAYFTAVFYNDLQITVSHNDVNFTSPDIRIYQQDDPAIPVYPNTIPLELRPLGAVSAQYIPWFDIETFEYLPLSPSVLTGTSSQSVFFVASVDLYNNGYSAIDKTRFMLDTGAQISVIGSRIASRLAIDPANPDFEVEIQGVTGDIITAPGFYIDSIDIPALGNWLSYTNIPVILLDIPSPEGGTVDGIIGMNLFCDINFVFRGGGLFLQDDPSIDYQIINRLTGDISPSPGDGIVDYIDLASLADAWLSNPLSLNWNSRADIIGDAIINFCDFAVLAQNWLQATSL